MSKGKFDFEFKEELMGKLKKLVATACFITMTFGAVAPVEASLKEKDIVWMGTSTREFDGRLGEANSKINGIFGETIIYTSRESNRMQIYYGKSNKKTGFIYKDIVPILGGEMFFVTKNTDSYEGAVVDDEGNEIFTGFKNIADKRYGSSGYPVEDSEILGDNYICGETEKGLVILDVKNGCKVLKMYEGYTLGKTDEVYKKIVSNRRYVLIMNKKKNKRGFMWISQKSGDSGILAKNLKLNADLLINKDAEYRIAVPVKNDDDLNIYDIKGKLIVSGKNKEFRGVAGNVLNTPGSQFSSSINPPKGLNPKSLGNKMIFEVYKNGKYGLVRDDGKQLLGFKYSGMENVYENMAVVAGGSYNYYYLINYKGKKLTKKKYRHIYGFYNGKAVVKFGDKYGVISDTGKEIIEPVYDEIIGVNLDGDEEYDAYDLSYSIKDISEGMILYNGFEYTYMDKDGNKKVFEKNYDSIKRLADLKHKSSSLFVASYDGKFGIIAADGKEIHKTDYDFFGVLDKKRGIFSLGKRKYGKSGSYISEIIIDKDGKKLFEISHTKLIERLASGEYMVIRDKSASKDKKTDQVLVYSSDWKKVVSINNKWDYVVDYNDGLFIVSKQGEYGLVDKGGKEILPLKYSSLTFDNGYIMVSDYYENVIEKGFLFR